METFSENVLKIRELPRTGSARNEERTKSLNLPTVPSSEGCVASDLPECRFRGRFIFVMDSRWSDRRCRALGPRTFLRHWLFIGRTRTTWDAGHA